MSIDADRVKEFWDARARKLNDLSFESIVNLEQDPDSLKLKIELETEKVFDYLGAISGKSIIDFGAGVGQWALRFLDRNAKAVTAVEYSADLVEIGRCEAARRGVTNLRFVVAPAEDYSSDATFDIVYISGLFVYMNDDQAEKFVRNLPAFCGPDTIVLMRDGTAVFDRHEINNRHSDHLQTMYSAIYRSRAEYLELFGRYGFSLTKDENMFDESCPLNKYPETRLRIYSFSSPSTK